MFERMEGLKKLTMRVTSTNLKRMRNALVFKYHWQSAAGFRGQLEPAEYLYVQNSI